MALVEFERVRDHLRLDEYCDALTVELYQLAAEAAITSYLDRPVLPPHATLPGVGTPGYDGTAIKAGPDIAAAVLLLTASLYENRESGGIVEPTLPVPVRALLAPWRVWRPVEEPLPEEEEESDAEL